MGMLDLGQDGGSITDRIDDLRPGLIMDKDGSNEMDMSQMRPGLLEGDDLPIGRLRRQNNLPVLVDEVMGN